MESNGYPGISDEFITFDDEQGCIMFRNVYFNPGDLSISFREFRVIFNAEVHFLPDCTELAYFNPVSGYPAFATLYAPDNENYISNPEIQLKF